MTVAATGDLHEPDLRFAVCGLSEHATPSPTCRAGLSSPARAARSKDRAPQHRYPYADFR
jgi:hypothetical protein